MRSRPAPGGPLTVASLAALAAAFASLAACHGHRADAPAVALRDFTVVAATEGPLRYLDDPIAIVFSVGIDRASVDARSVQIVAASGPAIGQAPRGHFEVASDASGEPHTLRFWPQLPLGDDPTASGFAAETTYLIVLAGADSPSLPPLRDLAGRALPVTRHFAVVTPAAGNIRPAAAPELRQAVATTLDEAGNWRCGAFAGGPAELLLHFAGPLDPSDANLPRTPTAARPGPLQLRYDDPERGPDRWIAADVELLDNTQQGATVLLRPRGVLPNAARIAVVRTRELRAFGGAAPAQDAEIAAFTTPADYRLRFDALVAGFAGELPEEAAAFAEPVAQVVDGALRSPEPPFGAGSEYDFAPQQREVVIDTDGVEWSPVAGPRQTPADGVMRVRDFHLPAGVQLRGIGSRPLVIVCDGDCVIDGELTVSGGSAVAASNLGQFRGPGDVPPPHVPGSQQGPQPSGNDPLLGRSSSAVGFCGGGHGGRHGSAAIGNLRSPTGQPGFGPAETPGGGGAGGRITCSTGCTRGSGGGGGSMATQGDPWFPASGTAGTPTPSFPQRGGDGGAGCTGASGASSRALGGGDAGPRAFADARTDNDFWGSGFDVHRQQRVGGELAAPQGGAGGGGGGDASSPGCEFGVVNSGDRIGGDGGAGGGVVIVQASGRIVIGRTGRIRADGGHGIGGEQAGASNFGGGGGGGAGGMVVLMSSERIVLHMHGDTFANLDYDFAISADGGVCRTGTFSSPIVHGKYPMRGQPVIGGPLYDSAPLGGFGGLGVIQLMAPIGGSNADRTNTVLDDCIDVLDPIGQPLQGADKQRFLAWRGYPDAAGTPVDDFGLPTNAGGGEGDLRPSPVLLPVPFGSRSRARRGWLPFGAVPRRPLQQADDLPRGVIASAGERGPQPLLQRLQDGWLPWRSAAGGLLADADAVLTAPLPIVSATAEGRHGRSRYRLELASPLAAEPDRHAGNLAELLGGNGEPLAAMTIREHEGNVLWLDAEAALPAAARQLQVRSWQLQGDFGGSPTPGAYPGGDAQPVPQQNVHLGLAFHRAPERALASGSDPDRLPHEVGTFWSDLQAQGREQQLLQFGATHAMWDVVLEQAFARSPADRPAAWNFHTPPLVLQRLLLRFRY